MITIASLKTMNKEIGEEGRLENASALEFAVDQANRLRADAFYKQLAYVARALLVDHAFVEGNKRTFTYLAAQLLKENKIELDTVRIWKLMDCIYKITTKRITSLEKIRLMLINELRR
jgi:prophage maintenance system killer protein